jgi:hypothetical protein
MITRTRITFNNTMPGCIIRIYDTMGRSVHDSGKIVGHNHEVDMRKLPAGVYFYKINNDSKDIDYSGKFLVAK